jgi:hypothetical protein
MLEGLRRTDGGMRGFTEGLYCGYLELETLGLEAVAVNGGEGEQAAEDGGGGGGVVD